MFKFRGWICCRSRKGIYSPVGIFCTL